MVEVLFSAIQPSTIKFGILMSSPSISYSAVVLDQSSRNFLLSKVSQHIPSGWTIKADHMTITLGPIVHQKGKWDLSAQYPIGSVFSLKVIAIRMGDRAIAVEIELPDGYITRNAYPHITIAINTAVGAQAKESNDLKVSTKLESFHLSGLVQEIPNKKVQKVVKPPSK